MLPLSVTKLSVTEADPPGLVKVTAYFPMVPSKVFTVSVKVNSVIDRSSVHGSEICGSTAVAVTL